MITAASLTLLPTDPSAAQASANASGPRVSLFTKDDAYLGAFFIAGTLALRPFDKSVAGALQRPSSHANHLFRNLATDVRLIADPGSIIIGTSMYAVGRFTDSDRLADLGLHGTEAILIGGAVASAIKLTVGRARPYSVRDTNPSDFGFLRGLRKGRDYMSFPSGHTLAAFAAAAAVSNEASRWWPGSQWYVGTAMYGGAAAVGLSRMYDNQHWASDVIMGAGIGTFAGNKVVRYAHRTKPNNRLDRWLLSGSVVPDDHGGFGLALGIVPRRVNTP
jgi:membrane-associated phospholipid phosphatase